MARAADGELIAWWRELVDRAEVSPLTIAEFCQRQDVSTASFYKWRRRFRENTRAGEGGFLPVDLSDARQSTVRIVLPQAEVEIPAANRELVLAVVSALVGRPESAVSE